MSNPPPIAAVAEIVLSVKDLSLMRQFYIETMGFPLFSESRHASSYDLEEGDPTIVFLKIADLPPPFGNKHPQLLVLIDVNHHAAAKERFQGHDVKQSTLNHLAFQIEPETYDAHLSRLQSLDLNPAEVRFPRMDSKAIFFEDPEGNLLELICHAA